jgi:hypothetical protein
MTVLAAVGSFPDVVWTRGAEWIAAHVHAYDGPWLQVWRDRVLVHQRPLLPGSAPFPVIGFDRVYYRENDSDTHAVLRSLRLEDLTGAPTTVAAGDLYGLRPIRVAHGFLAWSQKDGTGQRLVWRTRDPDGVSGAPVRDGTEQGISHILPDGTIRLTDETRTIATPAGWRTMPYWADAETYVCEGTEPEHGGALGAEVWQAEYGEAPRQVIVWPGYESFTPRIASAPDGTWRVVTWGRSGVRVETVAPPLPVYQPPTPVEPPVIIIDPPPTEPPPVEPPIDPEPPMPDEALTARVTALEQQVAILDAQVRDLEAQAIRDGQTVGLQDHWKGYVRSPDTPVTMAPDAAALGAWEQWRLVRVAAPDPMQDRPRPPLPVPGVVWPTPGPADIGMNREWLAQVRGIGISTIRTNVSILRSRENVRAQCAAVLESGLALLPIVEWPYDTTDPAVAVDFLLWLIEETGVGLVELQNEPWILDDVTGHEYLRVARPLAEAAEAHDPETRVVLAMDLFDHNSGHSRMWPGVQDVIACIAESPRRFAAIHNYRNPKVADWSAWGSRMAEHEAICAALGHARYLVTECGWKPSEGDVQASGANHIRELEILGSQGVAVAVIYAHLEEPANRDFDFGLFALGDTPDGPLVPRPAALALEAFLPPLLPVPAPEPPPLWPTLPATSLGCVDGIHYVQAWLGDAEPSITAEATAAEEWEQWGLRWLTQGDTPTVALMAANGCWLTAELDASLTLRQPAADDPGPWETWHLERVDATHAALRSHHGGYLRPEGGGGSTVAADGGGLGPWEVFAFSVDLTDPVAPPVAGGLPSTAAALDVRAEFLCAPGFEWAFMYPGWSPEDRRAYRVWCRDQGHTHLFFAPWGAYRAEPQFDFRRDPIGFRALIDEAQAEGFVVVLFCLTDSLPGDEGYTEDEAHAFIRDWLSQFNDLIRFWVLGWECVQINSSFDRAVKGDRVVQTVVREHGILTPEEHALAERRWRGPDTPAPQPEPRSYQPLPPHSDRLYWLWSGDAQHRILQTMRQTFGPDRILGIHYTPERITGWPDYGHTDSDPRGEPDWWWHAGGTVDDILYQRAPEEPDDETVAHTTGGRTADGVDIGDANRIAGACTWQLADKAFTAFEFSRDLARCARLRDRFDTSILSGNGNLGEF